jgi:hypothetical protein
MDGVVRSQVRDCQGGKQPRPRHQKVKGALASTILPYWVWGWENDLRSGWEVMKGHGLQLLHHLLYLM